MPGSRMLTAALRGAPGPVSASLGKFGAAQLLSAGVSGVVVRSHGLTHVGGVEAAAWAGASVAHSQLASPFPCLGCTVVLGIGVLGQPVKLWTTGAMRDDGPTGRFRAMSEDVDRIYESAETLDAAFAAVKKAAAEKWGHGNFGVTVNPNPSKNLTTGQTPALHRRG